MAARIEVKLGERFNVLNRITWNKGDLPTGGRHKSVCKEELRSFFPASESIIFCEHYGADNIAKGEAGYAAKCDELRGFVFEPLRAYLDGEREKLKLSSIPFDKILGTNALAKKYFNVCQWALPTQESYKLFQQAFPGYFLRPYEELRRQYEELRRQYEELRRQYEELRRPFSVTAEVPYTDVWSFPTVSAYPGKHPCEKPLVLLDHIIKASSREGDVVLDCFAGSGSTLDAAKRNNRNFIGIEIDPHWVALANQRLGNFEAVAPSPEARQAWLESRVTVPVKKPEPNERQLTIWDFGIEKAG